MKFGSQGVQKPLHNGWSGDYTGGRGNSPDEMPAAMAPAARACIVESLVRDCSIVAPSPSRAIIILDHNGLKLESNFKEKN